MPGRTFNLFGFPVEVQSNALVMAGILLLYGLGESDIIGTLLLIAVATVSLLVHELGHAFASRYFGLAPISITIHGLGGLTHHTRPSQHSHSLIISIAGPAAGLTLFAIGLGLEISLGHLIDGYLHLVVAMLIQINLIWSLFNLLPIFPMDGGMALLAGLNTLKSKNALPITLTVGLALSLALMAAALVLDLGLFVIIFAGMFIHQNGSGLLKWYRHSRKFRQQR